MQVFLFGIKSVKTEACKPRVAQSSCCSSVVRCRRFRHTPDRGVFVRNTRCFSLKSSVLSVSSHSQDTGKGHSHESASVSRTDSSRRRLVDSHVDFNCFSASLQHSRGSRRGRNRKEEHRSSDSSKLNLAEMDISTFRSVLLESLPRSSSNARFYHRSDYSRTKSRSGVPQSTGDSFISLFEKWKRELDNDIISADSSDSGGVYGGRRQPQLSGVRMPTAEMRLRTRIFLKLLSQNGFVDECVDCLSLLVPHISERETLLLLHSYCNWHLTPLPSAIADTSDSERIGGSPHRQRRERSGLKMARDACDSLKLLIVNGATLTRDHFHAVLKAICRVVIESNSNKPKSRSDTVAQSVELKSVCSEMNAMVAIVLHTMNAHGFVPDSETLATAICTLDESLNFGRRQQSNRNAGNANVRQLIDCIVLTLFNEHWSVALDFEQLLTLSRWWHLHAAVDSSDSSHNGFVQWLRQRTATVEQSGDDSSESMTIRQSDSTSVYHLLSQLNDTKHAVLQLQPINKLFADCLHTARDDQRESALKTSSLLSAASGRNGLSLLREALELVTALTNGNVVWTEYFDESRLRALWISGNPLSSQMRDFYTDLMRYSTTTSAPLSRASSPRLSHLRVPTSGSCLMHDILHGFEKGANARDCTLLNLLLHCCVEASDVYTAVHILSDCISVHKSQHEYERRASGRLHSSGKSLLLSNSIPFADETTVFLLRRVFETLSDLWFANESSNNNGSDGSRQPVVNFKTVEDAMSIWEFLEGQLTAARKSADELHSATSAGDAAIDHLISPNSAFEMDAYNDLRSLCADACHILLRILACDFVDNIDSFSIVLWKAQRSQLSWKRPSANVTAAHCYCPNSDVLWSQIGRQLVAEDSVFHSVLHKVLSVMNHFFLDADAMRTEHLQSLDAAKNAADGSDQLQSSAKRMQKTRHLLTVKEKAILLGSILGKFDNNICRVYDNQLAGVSKEGFIEDTTPHTAGLQFPETGTEAETASKSASESAALFGVAQRSQSRLVLRHDLQRELMLNIHKRFPLFDVFALDVSQFVG